MSLVTLTCVWSLVASRTPSAGRFVGLQSPLDGHPGCQDTPSPSPRQHTSAQCLMAGHLGSAGLGGSWATARHESWSSFCP